MGNGTFKSSVLVPGKKEAFYLSPPNQDKLPKNSSQGSILLGAISHGKLSYAGQEEGKDPRKNPVSYQISYVIPPNKTDEDKRKGSSAACTKPIAERLEEEVRDAKLKVFGSLKQDTDEGCSEWKKLAQLLKSEYPEYTPLLVKIMESLLSRDNIDDKTRHYDEVIDAANEVIDSIDRDELEKFFSLKSDPEDEEAEKNKKKMETSRNQLAQALYQKGLALAEIETLKGEKASVLAAIEGTKDSDQTGGQSAVGSDVQSDLFEENFKELTKWVDLKSSKYGTLSVLRERRCGRLGTALKVFSVRII
ncbi:hypothetical protein Golob_013054 [Gossypium lobatum]|uniref:Tripeptidyl peptidase II Ig-like domain-containing protein n=1 Tax=Gossypium lobatum TaxID=34289 RepID=A0A7J8LNA5_9ROSI|nr:hypothetical protein [Gossypium lobatum]